jgi:electron transport complex protein RnfC
VLVEPAEDTDPTVFDPIHLESDNRALLMDRIKEAGIVTDALRPRPLLEVIVPSSGERVETLVVLAQDREPEVSASLRLFQDRRGDVAPAARLLARIAGAKKVLLALPEPLVEEGIGLDVEILSLPAGYPESLEPLVALRAGGGAQVRVVSLECALAALEAVRDGKVQDRKALTVIGPEGKALCNYRVHLGTRLSDLLEHADLQPEERDKVVMGGAMRGFSQYALDAAVDAGVDAVMLTRSSSMVDWSDEPCINCGGCVYVCPVNLQVQLIGRYAEFGIFDRTEELGVFHCIECGLCASVCTARRPLVQFIRLAKDELRRKRADMERQRAEATVAEEEPTREEAESVVSAE